MTDERLQGDEPMPEALLVALEALAAELAALAGAEIAQTLGREIAVEYKDPARGAPDASNPVSEVDRAVEDLIRERVGERFPQHGIVGEEVELHPDPAHEFLWVIDPVDGTTNFVNGFPLFSASVGVLHRGRPVAGAIWCSTSHELRAGVYHAHAGGALRFDARAVPTGRPSTGVRRRVMAAPGGAPGRMTHWDTRVTGSTAIECAFVAAGIFVAARFWNPALWDVAAGVVLVRAAGLEAWVREGNRWQPLEAFAAPASVREERTPTLRDWHRPLVIGQADAVAALLDRARRPPWSRRLRLALRALRGR
ncbi:MAG: inositol monophosphatase [Chloroflexi bacterium]|nr:inositol monophosphatase [Chloroflexota bacterium]